MSNSTYTIEQCAQLHADLLEIAEVVHARAAKMPDAIGPSGALAILEPVLPKALHLMGEPHFLRYEEMISTIRDYGTRIQGGWCGSNIRQAVIERLREMEERRSSKRLWTHAPVKRLGQPLPGEYIRERRRLLKLGHSEELKRSASKLLRERRSERALATENRVRELEEGIANLRGSSPSGDPERTHAILRAEVSNYLLDKSVALVTAAELRAEQAENEARALRKEALEERLSLTARALAAEAERDILKLRVERMEIEIARLLATEGELAPLVSTASSPGVRGGLVRLLTGFSAHRASEPPATPTHAVTRLCSCVPSGLD